MTTCRFCEREVRPGKGESHDGSLCGSCWEVCYRIRDLVRNEAFRDFVIKVMARRGKDQAGE